MELDSSIIRERHHFLRKLKTNPFFLLQHLPTISRIVWHRYQRKYNRKHKAKWLRPLHFGEHTLTTEEVWEQIPFRQHILSTGYRAYTKYDGLNETSTSHDQDHEDYLAQHRFRELLLLNVGDNATAYQLPATIDQWLQSPPPMHDPAWETYSSCERVANLLSWITFLPIDARRQLPATVLPFLHRSLEHINQRVEYYGALTNNHILNNARAFVLLGVALKQSSAVQLGYAILNHFLPIFIQPQGMLRERSTHYQLIILNWLLDIYFFLQEDKQAPIASVLNRMVPAAAALCDSKGDCSAFIGDISPDHPPAVTTARLRVFFPKHWPAITAKDRHDNADDIQQFDDFYVWRNSAHRITLNWPNTQFPIGYPSHGHNDCTSFIWHHQEKPLLIDTGRARYQKEKISLQQKSALGHNIATIDDYPPFCESLVLQGNYWPEPYARAKMQCVRHKQNGRDALLLIHDGYRRATITSEQQRKIYFDEDNTLHVEDYFATNHGSANQRVTIKTYWHLANGFEVIPHTQSLQFQQQQTKLTVQTNANAPSEQTLFWHAWEYGEYKQHPLLIVTYVVTLPFTAKISFKVETLCVG